MMAKVRMNLSFSIVPGLCIGSYQHCQAIPQNICFDKPAAKPTIVQVCMDCRHLHIHAALSSGTHHPACPTRRVSASAEDNQHSPVPGGATEKVRKQNIVTS